MSGSEGQPLVSVITVVRNDAEGLVRTMDSVAAQDYRQIEYVVIDGASTDGTLEVLKKRQAEVEPLDKRTGWRHL